MGDISVVIGRLDDAANHISVVIGCVLLSVFQNDPVLQLSNPSRLFLILLSGNRGFSVGLIAVASLAQ